LRRLLTSSSVTLVGARVNFSEKRMTAFSLSSKVEELSQSSRCRAATCSSLSPTRFPEALWWVIQ